MGKDDAKWVSFTPTTLPPFDVWMANQKLVFGKGVIQNEQLNQDQRRPKRLTDIVSAANCGKK